MIQQEQEGINAQGRRNNDADGAQTSGNQGDYRRSEQRDDNPESFNDDYESEAEDELTEGEAKTENEDQH